MLYWAMKFEREVIAFKADVLLFVLSQTIVQSEESSTSIAYISRKIATASRMKVKERSTFE